MKISVFYEHMAEACEQTGRSMEEICSLVRSFGITGVEIENTRLYREGERIRGLLEGAGLEISCIYGFFDFGSLEEREDTSLALEKSLALDKPLEKSLALDKPLENLEKGFDMVRLARQFSVGKIMLIPGFVSKKDVHPKRLSLILGREARSSRYHRHVKNMMSALKKICEQAGKSGVTVVLEDFDDEKAPFATASQLKHFLEEVPGLYCAFDTGNFLYSEEDAFEVLPMFLPRIRHVHCKDRTFEKKEGETPKETVKGREMYSCAVGSGCIPMERILDEILASGYEDYFAIEHFGSLSQLQDMEQSARWLAEYEAGYQKKNVAQSAPE